MQKTEIVAAEFRKRKLLKQGKFEFLVAEIMKHRKILA